MRVMARARRDDPVKAAADEAKLKADAEAKAAADRKTAFDEQAKVDAENVRLEAERVKAEAARVEAERKGLPADVAAARGLAAGPRTDIASHGTHHAPRPARCRSRPRLQSDSHARDDRPRGG
jgi:membrane protein involved in colicin uptake